MFKVTIALSIKLMYKTFLFLHEYFLKLINYENVLHNSLHAVHDRKKLISDLDNFLQSVSRGQLSIQLKVRRHYQ